MVVFPLCGASHRAARLAVPACGPGTRAPAAATLLVLNFGNASTSATPHRQRLPAKDCLADGADPCQRTPCGKAVKRDFSTDCLTLKSGFFRSLHNSHSAAAFAVLEGFTAFVAFADLRS
jgi:hypothetical protein